MRSFKILALVLTFATSPSRADNPGVGLQLVADTGTVEPSKPIRVGVLFQHRSGFHTYYRAPGIVGMPTQIEWQLPEGFVAGELQWPVPEVTKMFDYLAYGYESDTLLFATITPPAEVPADLTIRAKVLFMACADTCHPGAESLVLSFPNSSAQPARFDAAAGRVPPAATLPGASARVDGSTLVLTLPSPSEDLVFLPDPNVYDPNSPQLPTPSGLAIPIMADARIPEGQAEISGLLGSFESGKFQRVTVPLQQARD